MNVEQGKPADAGDKRIKMTMVPVTPDNMTQAAQAISQWLQQQIAAAGGVPADKFGAGDEPEQVEEPSLKAEDQEDE